MAERPEDLNLPNTVISRIIKDALPAGVNVSKDARLSISKAASVFVLYATSCANNFAMNAKRKTISPVDVLEAMKEMEFDRFGDKLKECLEAYKKEQKERKSTAEQRKRERSDGVTDGQEGQEDEGVNEEALQEVRVMQDETGQVLIEQMTS